MAIPQLTPTQVFDQLNSGHQWSGSTITYAFPTSTSGLNVADGENSAFRPATAAQQVLFSLAIMTWGDLIDRALVPTTAISSQIEFAYTTSGIEYAHAYLPGGGTVWFNAAEPTLVNTRVGAYGFQTMLHEIGHALGLNHMGDYDGGGSWTPSSYQDSVVLSLMSYFGPSAPLRSGEVADADWLGSDGEHHSPQTPMPNDVRVIQQIYGTSTTTRTGDTVYGFGSHITGEAANLYNFELNRHPILTIFDSGGIDTLDLSGWSTRADIRLEPGAYSSANQMTNNLAIAHSALIENAVGGTGDDTLTGNAQDNELSGGPGHDHIHGEAGNDTLHGGSGNDSIDGGRGTDTAVLDGELASYTFTHDSITRLFTFTGASSGTDVFGNIEYFRFADVLRSAEELALLDSIDPTLVSTSPADNSTGASMRTDLVLRFSEVVQAGRGFIRILRTDGSVAHAIEVTDTTQVAIDGATVTVNPREDLNAYSGYHVNIDTGAFTDLVGNAYAGLSGSTAYNFFTANGGAADTTAPTLAGTTPTDGATGVATGVDLVLHFSEAVQAGSGHVRILNADGSLARTVSITDTALVAISGSTVTIDLGPDLAAGVSYRVSLAAGVFTDLAGNAFAGTGDSAAFCFSTAGTPTADDFPMTVSTPGVVNVDAAGTHGLIQFVNDGDLFRVDLVAGQTYVFSATSNGLPDPYLVLYGTDTHLITFNDDNHGKLNAEIHHTASATGTHYLGAFDFGAGLGAYTVSAARSEDDHPWSPSTSSELFVNADRLHGVINTPGDADLFKVTLVAGTTYVFTLTRAPGGLADPYLYLFGPDVSELTFDNDSGGDGNATITHTATINGTHYLGASDFGSDTGAYALAGHTLAGPEGLMGTEGDDVLFGTPGTDTVHALGGNDLLMGQGGDDRLDGGDGTDHAFYVGNRGEYTVSRTPDRLTVQDSRGLDGTDALTRIERLEFADLGLALDMDVTQAGGKAALMLGVLAGPAALGDGSLVSLALDFFGDGQSLLTAAQSLVDSGLTARWAGGSDNVHLVNWLSTNVTGAPPFPATAAHVHSLLDSGLHSQASLLAAVAEMPLNQTNVNLVGLAQQGLAYL